MLRLEGVRKRYRGRGDVLAGIDLDLVAGAPVAVVGANGTGKSTLLRVVAGASSPSAGTVTGRPSVVGYVPAQFPASTRMPVRAYLRHMAALHGAPGADPVPVLDALGFTGVLAAPVSHLSTGNAQKVGLAQALSCGARLLVLDEPWTNLDARAAAALERRLAEQVARGIALIVADHSGRTAGLPGVQVLELAGGRLAAASTVVSRAVGHAVIELRCPGPPLEVLGALPPVGESWTGPDLLTVRVPADRGDAVLAAALAAGCSVHALWREDAA